MQTFRRTVCLDELHGVSSNLQCTRRALDVHQLQLFLAVLELPSMTRAAEKTHLSPVQASPFFEIGTEQTGYVALNVLTADGATVVEHQFIGI